MTDGAEVQHEVLQRTLAEVAQEKRKEEEEAVATTPCVICLEAVSEPGVAVPCQHANFDFLCLLSWLEQRPNCPLCKLSREEKVVRSVSDAGDYTGKSDVASVKYDLNAPDGVKVYRLPLPGPSNTATSNATPPRFPRHQRPGFRRGRRPPREHTQRAPGTLETEEPVLRRRRIYRNQMYSLRVGSNRLSQYRELTPELFNRDEQLVSRARKWIRRELRVFSFLNPDSDDGKQDPDRDGRVARPGQQRLESRRGNNAEFLLEYVIAILRTVDVKGSAGQAEELLRDFLGRENARLFLHELQSWLRSPYMSVEDWDRNVQYESNPMDPQRGASGREQDRQPTPLYRSARSSNRGRVSKAYSPRPRDPGSSREAHLQARRVQYARDRYVPD